MKKTDSYNSRHFELSRKQFLILGVVIVVVAIGIGAYAGLGQAQSNMKMSPMILHIHPHLNITDEGKLVTVPAYIGIIPSLWKDHSLDNYQGMTGMAPLHTHDASGTIHIESSVNRNYTLGEFLNTWGGLDLNGKILKVTVDGRPITDFRNHVFKDGEQINLELKGK